MSDLARFRLCLVGLPNTGKTTYIAALWGCLTAAREIHDYRISEFPDNPQYLHEIAAAWIEGKKMPRNSLGATDRIEFVVETPAGNSVTIVLPDLPGEVFQNAVIRPVIDEDTARAVTGSDLLLLFVNAEKARTFSALGDYGPPPLSAATQVAGGNQAPDLAASETGADGTSSSEDGEVPSPSEFAIKNLDSDTLNTELLHRLAYLTRDRGLPPLLVVVAAWDSIHGPSETPRQWLLREQPMIAQYLEEVGRFVPTGVLGVSAQGANYEADPDVIQKLASERPWARDETGGPLDIAGPLSWYERVILET